MSQHMVTESFRFLNLAGTRRDVLYRTAKQEIRNIEIGNIEVEAPNIDPSTSTFDLVRIVPCCQFDEIAEVKEEIDSQFKAFCKSHSAGKVRNHRRQNQWEFEGLPKPFFSLSGKTPFFFKGFWNSCFLFPFFCCCFPRKSLIEGLCEEIPIDVRCTLRVSKGVKVKLKENTTTPLKDVVKQIVEAYPPKSEE